MKPDEGSRAAAERAWPARGPALAVIAAVAVLVGGFGTWAAGTRIAGAVVAPGRIEVESNRQVVQHPDGGVVLELAVHEGARVAAGDALLRLDPSELSAEIAELQSRLWEGAARRARLEAERDGAEAPAFKPALLEAAEADPEVAEAVEGQRSLYRARAISRDGALGRLAEREAQAGRQIEGMEAQSAALERQLDLTRREIADLRTLLDRGLAEMPRMLALERDAARIEGTLGELAASRAEAAGRIAEFGLERLAIDTDRREAAIAELRDLLAEDRVLAERLRAARLRAERLDLRAPVGGLVHGLTVFGPGSVVRAAEPVLYIVPQDRPLVAVARVDAIDVDQVHPGQGARLRLAAFDARTTPELLGTVSTVSADAILDERTGAAYYRAEIVIPPEEVEAMPEGRPLVPGMPVEAFLRTEDQTPLAYLVQPLAGYFARAFRER